MNGGKTDSSAGSLAFVFPGQGSQSVGMMARLERHRALIEAAFDEASRRLDVDLWDLTANGPAEQLNRTENTQPVLLAAGVAAWRVWREAGGPPPAYAAGHSLGEYTALVAAGALDLSDGAWLVAQRGRLMQEAVPAGEGAMAAILGLDEDTVRGVCAEAAQDQVVAAANLNAEGQVVIAGHAEAVERAIGLAREAGARHALKLAVSVPSHCSLMAPAAEKFAACLDQVPWQEPAFPVIHNADVRHHQEPARIREVLIRQLEQPVRWVETVNWLRDRGIRIVIESGPGRVLSKLIGRADGRMQCHALVDDAAFDQALAGAAA